MIVIYGAKSCGFCPRVIQECKSHGLRYEYRDINYRKWYLEFQKYKAAGVPFIIANGTPIGDFQQFRDYLLYDYQP